MFMGWHVRKHDLEVDVSGYQETRLLLGLLLVAIKREAPGTQAEYLAFAGVWLLKACIDGMTDEVYDEWKRLAALPVDQQRRVIGDAF